MVLQLLGHYTIYTSDLILIQMLYKLSASTVVNCGQPTLTVPPQYASQLAGLKKVYFNESRVTTSHYSRSSAQLILTLSCTMCPSLINFCHFKVGCRQKNFNFCIEKSLKIQKIKSTNICWSFFEIFCHLKQC